MHGQSAVDARSAKLKQDITSATEMSEPIPDLGVDAMLDAGLQSIVRVPSRGALAARRVGRVDENITSYITISSDTGNMTDNTLCSLLMLPLVITLLCT